MTNDAHAESIDPVDREAAPHASEAALRDVRSSLEASPRRSAAPRQLRASRSVVVACAVVGAAAAAVLFGADAAHAQRKKITLDDLVIEGNIQKPEAFFILPRTNLNFADLERREDLKARVVESVELQPF